MLENYVGCYNIYEVEKKQKQQKWYFLVLTFAKILNCLILICYKIRNSQNFQNKTTKTMGHAMNFYLFSCPQLLRPKYCKDNCVK